MELLPALRPCPPIRARVAAGATALLAAWALGSPSFSSAGELAASAGLRRAGIPVQRPQVSPAPDTQRPLQVVARPDVAIVSGAVAAGSAGRLLLTQTNRLFGRNLRSTLDASLAFVPPRVTGRSAEPLLRQASARWSLEGSRGRRGHVAAWGGPTSTTIQARLETPLPGALALMCLDEWRWTASARGTERVRASTVDIRRRIAGRLVVQPGVFVTEVRAAAAWRTTGANLRVEWRGAQLALRHEFTCGSRWTVRKLWGPAPRQFILGGQYEAFHRRASRYLIELGLGRGALGARYFEGRRQRAGVLRLGRVQLGVSFRPAERRFVFGVGSASISVAQSGRGAPEVGVGFVIRNVLRRASRTEAGWCWRPPLGPAALEEPHLRWPGFASTLD